MAKPEDHGPIKCYGVDFFNYSPDMMVGAFEEHQYKTGMHMHDFLEVCVVLDGRCIHCTVNGDSEAPAGSVFVVTPGALHGVQPSEDDDAHMINLFFRRDFFQHYHSDLVSMVAYSALFTVQNPHIASLILSPDELGQLSPHMLALCRENLAHGFHITYQNALGLLIISMLCHMYASRIRAGKVRLIRDDKLIRCIEYMNQHLAEAISVEALSEVAFCSPSTLRRNFEALMGMSPTQYVTRLRLQKATELLQSTSVHLSDIAQQCGFYDSAHFSRKFHEYAGLSPKEYRKKYGITGGK